MAKKNTDLITCYFNMSFCVVSTNLKDRADEMATNNF